MTDRSAQNSARAGWAVMAAASIAQVWITIVGGPLGEDNPQNLGFFGVVITAMACAFVAKGEPERMARAMLAVAGVEALLASMLATAPITAAHDPAAPVRVVMLCGVFCLVWLAAAWLFRRAARGGARGPGLPA